MESIPTAPTTAFTVGKGFFPFQQPSPFCHPERTRISYFTALTSATFVVLSKENHMQSTEATTLDRKSGEADLSRRAVEGSAVRLSGAPNLAFYNQPTGSVVDLQVARSICAWLK